MLDANGLHRSHCRALSMNQSSCDISIAIPTYRRGDIVLETIASLRAVVSPAIEIVIIDQTEEHCVEVASRLRLLHEAGEIVWVKLSQPSIPAAMNHGLSIASGKIVLFLDDDIVPDRMLIEAHVQAHSKSSLVAGQVLQPGEHLEPLRKGENFRYNSTEPAWVEEFIGCNFSVDRTAALQLGGFDENFVGAAYRYEAEFAHRHLKAFGHIYFEPQALVHHLRLSAGGTRAHDHHLRTSRPTHSVGAYYYLLKTRRPGWWREVLWRPFRAVSTRHHLRRPWWIPATLVSELRGFLLALRLCREGPRMIGQSSAVRWTVRETH